MKYRDTAEVMDTEAERIESGAKAMCAALGIDGDTYIDQARMFSIALIINQERNEITPDAWQSIGFMGNLLSMNGKVLRLMSMLYWNGDKEQKNEKALDNAIDTINYSGFFARLFRDGNSHGGAPTFTNKPNRLLESEIKHNKVDGPAYE